MFNEFTSARASNDVGVDKSDRVNEDDRNVSESQLNSV